MYTVDRLRPKILERLGFRRVSAFHPISLTAYEKQKALHKALRHVDYGVAPRIGFEPVVHLISHHRAREKTGNSLGFLSYCQSLLLNYSLIYLTMELLDARHPHIELNKRPLFAYSNTILPVLGLLGESRQDL